MSNTALNGLRDYLYSTLSPSNMIWLGTQLTEYGKKKEEVEPTLYDTDITLDSYILSNTAYQDVNFWGTRPEFAENHVLFDEDDKYIETLFKRIVNR